MVRDVDLLSYLPDFIQKYDEIRQIMTTENEDVQKLEDETERIKNNQFIVSSDLVGIKKFETLLSISPDPHETLEARRSRVMIKWNDTLPYTYRALLERLEALCGRGKYEVHPDFKNYHIDFNVSLELYGQVDMLEQMLLDMMPCNIVCTSTNMIKGTAIGKSLMCGGICFTNTFSVSDAYKEIYEIYGSLGGGGTVIKIDANRISDSFKETYRADGSAVEAGTIVKTEILTVTNDFKETISMTGPIKNGAGTVKVDFLEIRS
jgi:hypothetical protein